MIDNSVIRKLPNINVHCIEGLILLSEPDIFDTSQYCVDCESCKENADFYCNNCHQRLCGNCQEEHLRNPDNIDHDTCSYKNRKWMFPSPPCKKHPRHKLALYCKKCHRAICAICVVKDHENHGFLDIEDMYTENVKKAIVQFIRLNVPPQSDLQRSRDMTLNRKEKQRYVENLIYRDRKTKQMIKKTLTKSAKDSDIDEGCSDYILNLFLLDIFW